jgi:LacI family transcriptional regulator
MNMAFLWPLQAWENEVMVSDPDGKERKRPAAATIYHVADHAGVSPMTVSRVIAGGKNVRQDKIDRVLASIAELGYRKNENARSIRPGQRTGLVGVVVTNIANPYYAEVQLGIEEILGTENLRLLVGNSNEDVARERQLIADFTGRQVDGLILVPAAGDDIDHLKPEAIGFIPLVLASRGVTGLDVDTVLIDDISGAHEGTRRLIGLGHRRIAYVGGFADIFTSQRRLQGFRQAHADAQLAVDPTLVRTGHQHPQQAQRAIEELLRLPSPPTAIFSGNNRNSIGVIRALLGVELTEVVKPGSIPVVCFDNFELSDLVPIPLIIIDHDPRDLGRHAGQLLLERLRGDADPVRHVQLPTRLLGWQRDRPGAGTWR